MSRKDEAPAQIDKEIHEAAVRAEFREDAEVVRAVRAFSSGATRDTDSGKLDYEAFLSPAVLQRYAQYMHEHRIQSDGTLRTGDNWQKGIPQTEYIKSMFRHFMDLWIHHRTDQAPADNYKAKSDALCAIIFNAMGMLFNLENDNDALHQ